MKSAVIVFPGSNCDRDAATVMAAVAGTRVRNHQWQSNEPSGEDVLMVWHGHSELPKVDLVILPGGFSYGDYLRSGAMAAHSPIMKEVIAHAHRGGLVLGICNGFQVLTQSGLLPGTLMRNAGLKFVCREAHLRVENDKTPFTSRYRRGQVINVPVAHHDGNYFADDATLKTLEDKEQIAFRYCTADGAITPEANPNGSQRNIAGIFNAGKNVLGMMPHPERHADPQTGGVDGRAMFEALIAA